MYHCFFFFFFIYAYFNLMFSHGKRDFLRNSNSYLYLIQLMSKFHETSWLYCLSKVKPYALDFAFFNLTLCNRKREFLEKKNPILLVKFQFELISHSVSVKISRNFMVLLLIISFTMCPFFSFIYSFFGSMFCHRKTGFLVKLQFLQISHSVFVKLIS